MERVCFGEDTRKFPFLFKESLFTVLEQHALSMQQNIKERACTYDFQRDAFSSNYCGMNLGARPIAQILANDCDFAHGMGSGSLRHQGTKAPSEVNMNRGGVQ